MKRESVQYNKKEIEYEDILAGALARIEQVDDYDIYIIAEEMKKLGLNVSICTTYELCKIEKYVKVIAMEEGKARLNNVTLDSVTEKGIAVRDYLNKMAGNPVVNFFKEYDFSKHMDRKKECLQSTELILNNTNVLIISNDDDQINELKNYGYKKVNSFKSIVRADNYFKKYPKELEDYDLVLIGDQDLDAHDSRLKLISRLYELQNERKLTLMHFYKVDFERDKPYTLFAANLSRLSIYFRHYNNLTDVYDKIMKQLKLNNLIKPITDRKLKEIKETVNNKKIKLPKRKKDIKILFCASMLLDDYMKDVVKDLNLNVTILADNNMTKTEIQDKLGDYDIIIVSDMFSHSIINYIKECNEQCKASGRKFVMLVSYDGSYRASKEYYNEVKLTYNFAGELASEPSEQTKKFSRVFGEKYSKESGLSEYHHQNKELTQAILEEVVNIYSGKLKEISGEFISDLDFKTSEEHTKEFKEEFARQEKIKEEEQKRKQKELEPLKLYYNARAQVLNYLYYKRRGLVSFIKKTDGINIIEELSDSEHGEVTVQNIYENRTLCTITFNKKIRNNDEASGNVAIFDIGTLNAKGNLEESYLVGLYTSEYKEEYPTIEYLNEKQYKAMEATCKKIINVLGPMNKEAYDIAQQIKNGTYAYSKRRKNKKRNNK